MDDKREIKISGKGSSKLSSFWFYYKWHIIIAVLALAVIAVCTVQACSREKEDMSIVYAGSAYIDGSKYDEITKLLSSVLPEDIDGDGKKNVSFVKYQIYSNEEIKELQGNGSAVDTARNSSNYSSFTTYMMTGDSSVCFLSKDIYESLRDNGRLRVLSEVFGEAPSNAYDEYAVRLSDTDLYKYNSAVQAMGEDTFICVALKTVNKNEKNYASEVNMFKAIVNYSVKQ